MNTEVEDLLIKIKLLDIENDNLRSELKETKDHLKKYTAPDRNKKYYEKNKESLLNKIKQKTTSNEKRKEYNRISYLRRKEKQELINNS